MPHLEEQVLGFDDPGSSGDKGRRLDSNQGCLAQLLCLPKEDQNSHHSNMEGGGAQEGLLN